MNTLRIYLTIERIEFWKYNTLCIFLFADVTMNWKFNSEDRSSLDNTLKRRQKKK
jgi:hypothetical protein